MTPDLLRAVLINTPAAIALWAVIYLLICVVPF